jgi:hypothetical protein
MAFEKKEGAGSLFYNDAASERHPIHKGYIIWKGEEIQLALWAGKEGSKVSFSVKAEAKRERREDAPQQSITARAQATIRRPDSNITSGRPRDDMNDDIPF